MGCSGASEGGELLFVRIPKNASATLYEAFGESNVLCRDYAEYADKVPDEWALGIYEKSHISLKMAVAFLGERVLDLSVVVCSRNPYDRLVSMYSFAVTRGLIKVYSDKSHVTFDVFVEDVIARGKVDPMFFPGLRQVDWLDEEIRSIFHIQYENLVQDYLMVCDMLGIKAVEKLPHHNRVRRAEWQRYYSPETAKLVYDYYKEDFEAFNYDKEIDHERTQLAM